jgi:hypothetical protein
VIRDVVDMVNERLGAIAEEYRGELGELERSLGRLSQQQDRYYRAVWEGRLEGAL